MTTTKSFKDLISQSLRLRPTPLIIEADGLICPAASLYTGARAVAKALVRSGYLPGDRIAYTGKKGICFVQALIGVIEADMVFCPVDPLARDREPALAQLNPCLILDEDSVRQAIPNGFEPRGGGLSDSGPGLMLWTSGSSGEKTHIRIPPQVIAQQVEFHLPLLEIPEDSTFVSYLPWTHAFGGVLELFCALCSGSTIQVVETQNFDANNLVKAISSSAQNRPWLFSVPKAVAALADCPGGIEALTNVAGGVIGGAPLDKRLCDLLTEFAVPLRVGYGQTECGPGVMLGEVGYFKPGLLGRPVGCTVSLSESCEIIVEGDNVCSPEGVSRRGTGDLGCVGEDENYYFKGRVSGGWKWSSGRKFFPDSLSINPNPEQCLLKADGDSVVVVSMSDANCGATFPVAVSDRITVPEAFRAGCLTENGKVSANRTAQVVRRCFPEIALDRHLYPEDPVVRVGPLTRLDPSDLVSVARTGMIGFDELALESCESSNAFAIDKAESETPIYGWKTGFGPHVDFPADDVAERQGHGLICHLQAGQGDALPLEVVRGMIAFRLHTLTQGHSGVSVDTVKWLRTALRRDLVPIVPEFGSVGASGDLVPMAHAVAAYQGYGEMALLGKLYSAEKALAKAGLEPLKLPGRDALALVNGTPLMTSLAAHAVEQFRDQLRSTCELTALLMDLVDSPTASLSSRLHAASGHETHLTVAGWIRDVLGHETNEGRCLQEPYSIRCAPQLLGACLTVLKNADEVVRRELNGVADNPLFLIASNEVTHGGNFFGQEIAFAMDSLGLAIVQAANLVERQLALLLEPVRNGGLPLLLSSHPGKFSGLAGVQLSSTATVAEMRRQAMPASIQSLPTNGMNQDIVPFGTHAALNAMKQSKRFDLVLGAQGFAVRQAYHLKQCRPKSLAANALLQKLERIAPLTQDRALSGDVRNIADLLRVA